MAMLLEAFEIEIKKALLILKGKLAFFQRTILLLKEELKTEKQAALKAQQSTALEIIEVLDAFDLVLKQFENASQLPDNPNAPALKRILSNYRAVQRKLARILSNQNISKIELPENQAVPGLCKVIRTEPHDELEPGTILEILKPGYQDPTQILRPVEVVTVAKTSSNQATSH